MPSARQVPPDIIRRLMVLRLRIVCLVDGFDHDRRPKDFRLRHNVLPTLPAPIADAVVDRIDVRLSLVPRTAVVSADVDADDLSSPA